MNILVITGSPRQDSNSTILAKEFARGAHEHGHLISYFDAGSSHLIHPCMACNYCRDNIGQCAIADDYSALRPKVLTAEMIVFASPIYYFGLSSQIKAVIDRFYGLNPMKEQMYGKKRCVLITTQGQKSQYASIPVMAMYQDILGLYGWEDSGQIHACGLVKPGSVKETIYMKQAYEMGLSIK